MTFWEHFARLLPHKPRQALTALYWHLSRRRVRARNLLRTASADLAFVYAAWIRDVERLATVAAELPQAIEKWSWRPRFSVLIYADEKSSPDRLERTQKSLIEQRYPFWTLITPPADVWQNGLTEIDGDFIFLVREGNLLSPLALYRVAEALQTGRASVLYGDEDYLNDAGRRYRPWFKPCWNEEMFLALDYLSDAVAVEVKLAHAAAASTSRVHGSVSAFLLAATNQADGAITHISHVLCHVADNGRTSLHGLRLGEVARLVEPHGATCSPGLFGTVKVEWPLPEDPPLVTIIVPTRDKLELLKPCIERVLDRTDYPNFEVLIVDNDSVERRTAEFLTHVQEDIRVNVRVFHGPYNFSTMNNFAVSIARGAYVCLLNNDTEVLEPAWLSEMMRYAVRPDVGAVGAKLLYQGGTIQHAGVVIGLGEAAGHAHRFASANEAGYFAMPHVAQFVSAVTAACLLVEKAKFEAVQGLDQELAHAFNDVDLCLKLRAAGWRNVYTPHAVLIHHESKTRPKDQSPDQIDRFRYETSLLQERWGTRTYVDPQHNVNLDRSSETFVIDI